MNTSPPLPVGELTGLYPRSNAIRLALWLWKKGEPMTYRTWQKPEKRK